MKKYIPLVVFMIGFIFLTSCRDDVETISSIETHLKTKDANYLKTDSLDIQEVYKENDPDPPVKDGQDWRGASAPLSNHASAYFGFAQ